VCEGKSKKESEGMVEYLKWLWRYNKSEREKAAKANVSEKEKEDGKCGGGEESRDGDEAKRKKENIISSDIARCEMRAGWNV
jgi:hypothetical protein